MAYSVGFLDFFTLCLALKILVEILCLDLDASVGPLLAWSWLVFASRSGWACGGSRLVSFISFHLCDSVNKFNQKYS